MSNRESARAQMQRKAQEREQMLAERGMQIKFLAMELQRKEYATYSLSECIGALFAAGDAILRRFEELDEQQRGAFRRKLDPVLAAQILNLRAVQERYQRSAVDAPQAEEQVEETPTTPDSVDQGAPRAESEEDD